MKILDSTLFRLQVFVKPVAIGPLAVASIFGLSLVAASSLFDRVYDLPQILGLCLLSSLLWFRNSIPTFTWKEWCVSAFILAAAFLAPSLKEPLALISISAALCFLFSTLEDDDREKVKVAIIFVAACQTLLIFISYFSSGEPDSIGLRRLNSVPVGTVGNPDFLATVIAAAMFFLIRLDWPKWRRTALLAVLFAGLIATRSRGTIAIVTLFSVIQFIPRWATVAVVTASAGLVGLMWERFAGRVQLWWTSIVAISNKTWLGYGLDNFDSAYFNTNLQIMAENQNYRRTFGPWSSQVSDAHNLLLQWGVEFGVLGLAIAAAVIVGIFRRTRSMKSDEARLAWLLIIKSLYNVVLISVQALGLLALVLAPKRIKQDGHFKIGMFVSLFVLTVGTKASWMAAHSSHDLRRSMAFLSVGLPTKAIELTDRILIADKENTDALLAKSYAFLKLGNCSHSSLYALRASHLRQNMDVYKRAGHILFECGFYLEALSLFDDLHLVFPEHRTTTMKIAWSHYFLGNHKVAGEFAKNVLQSTPRRKSHSDDRNQKEARELIHWIATN